MCCFVCKYVCKYVCTCASCAICVCLCMCVCVCVCVCMCRLQQSLHPDPCPLVCLLLPHSPMQALLTTSIGAVPLLAANGMHTHTYRHTNKPTHTHTYTHTHTHSLSSRSSLTHYLHALLAQTECLLTHHSVLCVCVCVFVCVLYLGAMIGTRNPLTSVVCAACWMACDVWPGCVHLCVDGVRTMWSGPVRSPQRVWMVSAICG